MKMAAYTGMKYIKVETFQTVCSICVEKFTLYVYLMQYKYIIININTGSMYCAYLIYYVIIYSTYSSVNVIYSSVLIHFVIFVLRM